jgi:hypothetical protein
VGLAPSTQTIGSLLRAPLPVKPDEKWIRRFYSSDELAACPKENMSCHLSGCDASTPLSDARRRHRRHLRRRPRHRRVHLLRRRRLRPKAPTRRAGTVGVAATLSFVHFCSRAASTASSTPSSSS